MRGRGGAVNYYVADHLGSSRIVTNASGTVLDDSDFYPFGGERSYSSGSGNNYKFTGKERDAESGLDDFAARFYTSNYGRFLSADDSKYINPADPQTLNLYSYVANNPLNAVDPTGHMLNPLPMQHGGGPTSVGPSTGTSTEAEDFGFGASAGVGSGQSNSGSTTKAAIAALSHEAEQAIEDSPLTAKQAVAFEDAVLNAANKTGVDANILVGLAYKESSLGANMTPHGAHKGLYKIEQTQMTQLNNMFKSGITVEDLRSLSAASMSKVSLATAQYLQSYEKRYSGASNPSGIEIGISAWRVGSGRTAKNLASPGNFYSYVDPHLKESVASYIAHVERFQ